MNELVLVGVSHRTAGIELRERVALSSAHVTAVLGDLVAQPAVREALALRRAGLPAGHRYIGDSLIELGTCLTGLRRFAEAEGHLLEAQRVFLAAADKDDDRVQRAGRRLQALYKAWGKPDPVTPRGGQTN